VPVWHFNEMQTFVLKMSKVSWNWDKGWLWWHES